jgi:predicted O-methyltransferase YrrM
VRVEWVRQLNRRLRPARHRVWASVLRLVGRGDLAAVYISRLAKGLFAEDETLLLYRAAREAEGPGDVAEIGSWMGRSCIVLGLALRDAGRADRRIYAIDAHVGSEEHRDFIAQHGSTFAAFQRNVADAGLTDRVEPLVMRSVDAAKVLAERRARLRLLFIDGAHDEASVREDIRSFLPLMQPGGTIALHDCEEEGGGFPGVWRAFAAELAPHVEIVGRARSLLVTRLKDG